MALFNTLLALHVLSVVWWIGGVFTVTTSLLPLFGKLPTDQRIARIREFEGRFANQARIAILIAGITGIWMLYLTGGLARLHAGNSWWLSLMILVWVLFTAMLFVAEPLGLPRKLGIIRSHKAFLGLHAVLLILALAAIVGGVVGARGGW